MADTRHTPASAARPLFQRSWKKSWDTFPHFLIPINEKLAMEHPEKEETLNEKEEINKENENRIRAPI